MEYSIEFYDGINGEQIIEKCGACKEEKLVEEVLNVISEMIEEYGEDITFTAMCTFTGSFKWETMRIPVSIIKL